MDIKKFLDVLFSLYGDKNNVKVKYSLKKRD